MSEHDVMDRAETAEGADPEEGRSPIVVGSITRLSVNLSATVAAALRALMAAHGTSATEEIRRAISLRKYLQDEKQRGGRIIIESDGDRRELLVDVY